MTSLLLLACSLGSRNAPGRAHDSSAPSDSGSEGKPSSDSGSETTPPPLPKGLQECELVNPFPITDGASFSEAWALRPDTATMSATLDLAEQAHNATGCPSLAEDGKCGDPEWTGCDNKGVVSEGTTRILHCVDGYAVSWDAFAIAWEDWSFSLNGSYNAYVAGNLVLTIDAELVADSICESITCSGVFDWQSRYETWGLQGSGHETWVAQVSAQPTKGTSGDFCVDEAVLETKGCKSEGVGWTVVRGTQDAMVVWDGDVACDGCGALYVGGFAVGKWCRSEWTAY
jgi:hypothetical protein